ncbi:hypothetical protein D9613_008149 [Agrocybe pediades]|uniref:Checkpoint protein n=1 Tax=Agrocybe pediades TaxID=84607 RepID=A0A8H4VKZ0_9AGAR|nr:hypothetical protein D9613_008149 [Agrocybe pediades]KAF9542161.1 cell cycle checkpoint [Agrocybe pediades]
MRFRATVVSVQAFFRLIQSVGSLQKKCFIKFNETLMEAICNNETNEGGIQVWARIKIESLFDNYRIQSNANNQITMSLTCDALLGALKSASASTTSSTTFDAEEVVMKLAKKDDQALLSFEIPGQTRNGQRVRVTHDVKIEIMRPSEAEKMTEPLCPPAMAMIVMPDLEKVRTIVDRMRQIADTLIVQGSNNGKLVLAVKTDAVDLRTEWANCENVETDVALDPEEDPDPEKLHTIYVSAKSFYKFLTCHLVSTTTIVSICKNHCLIIYVYIGDTTDAGGVLTFYIPAIIEDDEL